MSGPLVPDLASGRATAAFDRFVEASAATEDATRALHDDLVVVDGGAGTVARIP